eukprot:jgi/Tetstr1/459189/TSEL_004633.t1
MHESVGGGQAHQHGAAAKRAYSQRLAGLRPLLARGGASLWSAKTVPLAKKAAVREWHRPARQRFTHMRHEGPAALREWSTPGRWEHEADGGLQGASDTIPRSAVSSAWRARRNSCTAVSFAAWR